MYLSRVTLRDDFSRGCQLGRVITDNAYGGHRLLWDLFPGDKQRQFLFREDSVVEYDHEIRNSPLYYVLSSSEPVNSSPLLEVSTKPFSPQLTVGNTLSFKLRANPVVARRQEGKKHSDHHDVLMDAQRNCLFDACRKLGQPTSGQKKDLKRQLAVHPELTSVLDGEKSIEKLLQRRMDQASKQWLLMRGERNGFSIANNEHGEPSIEATGYRWHALPKNQRRAGFSSIDYAGQLIVTDTEAFLSMVYRGLGRAKAFGCGLFLIMRI